MQHKFRGLHFILPPPSTCVTICNNALNACSGSWYGTEAKIELLSNVHGKKRGKKKMLQLEPLWPIVVFILYHFCFLVSALINDMHDNTHGFISVLKDQVKHKLLILSFNKLWTVTSCSLVQINHHCTRWFQVKALSIEIAALQWVSRHYCILTTQNRLYAKVCTPVFPQS